MGSVELPIFLREVFVAWLRGASDTSADVVIVGARNRVGTECPPYGLSRRPYHKPEAEPSRRP
jgi:hypothetical protein